MGAEKKLYTSVIRCFPFVHSRHDEARLERTKSVVMSVYGRKVPFSRCRKPRRKGKRIRWLHPPTQVVKRSSLAAVHNDIKRDDMITHTRVKHFRFFNSFMTTTTPLVSWLRRGRRRSHGHTAIVDKLSAGRMYSH